MAFKDGTERGDLVVSTSFAYYPERQVDVEGSVDSLNVCVCL